MNVPKLRFKEFQDAWSPCVLNDFVSFAKGKGIAKADIDDDGVNFCIRYGELYTTYGQVIKTVVSKTNIAEKDSILSKAGDVIIPASGETQIDIATAACVTQNGIILGGDLNILSHSESGEWLAYYLSSTKKFEIAQLAQGNSVVHLYSSQLKDLSINKPSHAEQTKIASFLSSVDEKIAQLSRKHELLQQYKQGMMQQLFSQKLRFKDDKGEDFPEWEKLNASEIFENYSNKNHDRNLTILAATQDKGIIPREQIEIDIKTSDASIKSYKKIEIGNFVISLRSFQGGIEYSNYSGICSPAYTVLKSIKPINDEFYKNYLKTHDFIQKLNATVIGIRDGKQISYQAFSDLILDYPPSLKEQAKIANFLTAIDNKIEAVAKQLEQARVWKQGLLQQMFV